MILLDTDHFSVLMDRHHARHSQLVSRLQAVEDSVRISIVSVEEQLRGWLAQIRRVRNPLKLISPYDRLVRLLETLAEWEISRWTEEAAAKFAQLRRERIRVGTQDLRIASIAISEGALLLSANLRDFEKVPELRVEDWLYRPGSNGE